VGLNSLIRAEAEPAPVTWSSRTRDFYERHEMPLDLLFFAGGFVFDIFAASKGIDHLLVIVQQAAYLLLIGGILHLEFVHRARPDTGVPPWLARAWEYRSLALHFCLGTLANLYSIFFLMSASAMSSVAFVGLLFLAIALNEMKVVRDSGVDIKVGLFVLCVFCFFALMAPIAYGRVGAETFAVSLAGTVLALGLFYLSLRVRLGGHDLNRRLLLPGSVVTACFLASYLAGIIPPVPIAARKMGVYHRVERQGEVYALYRDPAPWTSWLVRDQRFVARPGDQIYAFVAVYSPARFEDAVFVRWELRDAAQGWQTSDRLPLTIVGGREEGFRAYTTKRNYSPGRWRVSVETSDGRQIGRLAFTVIAAGPRPTRALVRENY
jgi:hypothetical protein